MRIVLALSALNALEVETADIKHTCLIASLGGEEMTLTGSGIRCCLWKEGLDCL